MDIANLLIYGLAVWRISSALVNEDGPFKIFFLFRRWTGHMFDADRNFIGHKDGFLSEMLSCIWCMSVYVAIAVSFARYYFSTVTFYVCLCLAFSALAILIEKEIRGRNS